MKLTTTLKAMIVVKLENYPDCRLMTAKYRKPWEQGQQQILYRYD